MATPPDHHDTLHPAGPVQASQEQLTNTVATSSSSANQGKARIVIPEPYHLGQRAKDDTWQEPVYSDPGFRDEFQQRLYARYEAAQNAFDEHARDRLEQFGPVPAASSISRRRSAGEAELPPRPPPQTLRSTIRRASQRISMTPSELDAAVLAGPQARAEELLGIRRHTTAGPAIEMNDLSTQRRRLQIIDQPVYDGEPMNGLQAWLMALMAVLLVFNCWGFSNAFGLFQAYYEQIYIPHSSPAAISWIGSTQLALVFGLGVPVGRAVDKGYFRHCFHGGSALMLLSIFCSSFCTTWFTLWFVQGLLSGLAMGCIFTSGLVALMSWFDERRMGLAMGLPAAGSSLGGIIYILISRHYLLTQGFGPTMRILSGVTLATMILPNILFRERRRTRRPLQPAPRRQRFSPYLFLDEAYLLATAGLFFSFLGLYFGFIYLVSYAVQILHLDATAATNMLIYMLIVNLPGRLIPALISDRCTGPMNMIIPSTILSSVVLAIWAGSNDLDQPSLTILACFYGFVSAGIQSLYASTTYSFCLQSASPLARSTIIDRMGLKAGFLFSCIGVAVLIGTPIGGVLVSYRIKRGWDRPYLGAQVFAATSMFVGSLFLIAARIKKVGLRLRRA